jgi:hypothetical protein
MEDPVRIRRTQLMNTTENEFESEPNVEAVISRCQRVLSEKTLYE